MQLSGRLGERGSALLYVMTLTAAVMTAAYFGLKKMEYNASTEEHAQISLDLLVLRQSLLSILKDATFCAATLSVANNGSPPSFGAAMIALTQVNPGVVFIQTAPPNSTFNSLTITGISLRNMTSPAANQYTGVFHVDAASTAVLGIGLLSFSDIPITISTSPTLTCTGGP